MELNKIYQGDVLEVLKTFPDKSIDMVMTSPPYWALRDYGVKGQLGLEPTFDEYITKLCDIFDGVKRVLKDTGTCWVNIGDTYFGSGKGAGRDGSSKESWQFNEKEKRICQHCKKEFIGWKFQNFCGSACSGVDNTPREKKGKLPDKTLTMIPFRFAIEMVNRGWILRNTIIWHKPNCMPSSAKDRFTVDFEYLFLFSKKKKYYFEQVRTPHKPESIERTKHPWDGHREPMSSYQGMDISKMCHPEGRNKRCVWTIKTKPFPEAHFAVYPEGFCEVPIKAGCPPRVCNKCGIPDHKIKVGGGEAFNIKVRDVKEDRIKHTDRKATDNEIKEYNEKEYKSKIKEDVIFSCNCNAGFSPGIVLDPFMGAGTTACEARRMARNYVGIELKAEYIEIAKKRLAKIEKRITRWLK